MKNAILSFLIIFNFYNLIADTHDSSDHIFQNYYKYLNDSSENKLELRCGYTGSKYSKNIVLIRELIKAKRYDLVEKILDSKVNSSRYLASLTLILAQKEKLIIIKNSIKIKIRKIKCDNSKIGYCKGCFYGLSVSIKKLFKKFPKNDLHHNIKNWIISSFNLKNNI